MTERGTFIINGAERVIVNQIVRSQEYILKMNRIKMVEGLTMLVLSPIEVHG